MKANAIGILRLILSGTVILAHSSVLGGVGDRDILEPFSIMAVGGFFSISGYLLTASYLRTGNLARYLWNRVLRIFPAYWVCILICAIALPLCFGLPPSTEYIYKNVFLDQGEYRIPGIFENNPYPGVINGSLWTLGHEFRAYLILGIIGFTKALNKYSVLAAIALSWVWLVNLSGNFVELQAPLLLCHFFIGSALFLFDTKISHGLALLSMLAIALSWLASQYFFVAPVLVSVVIFYLAFNLPIQDFGRTNDYSYGIYIYSFPVQQLLTAFDFHEFGFVIYFVLSIACTLPFAIASWHLIEKPALQFKNILRSP